MEAKERKKPLVKDLNEHIVCPLCRGYLIDATTLMECLHSFCRGCIVRRLSNGARVCPVCNVATSPRLLPDTRLQRLVYLAVPSLFRSELKRRGHFRRVNPQCPPLPPPVGALELTLEDLVSLSLQELEDTEEGRDSSRNEVSARGESNGTRYLRCQAAVTVRHLMRLLMLKRGWEEGNATVNCLNNRIEIMYQEDETQYPGKKSMHPLDPFWTLLDVACIFQWKRESPMKLFYQALRKEKATSLLKVPSCKDDVTKDIPPAIENIQRPPTPPPSPRREQEVGGAQPAPILETTNIDIRDKEINTKKPRCEVTPVMRTLDFPSVSELSTSRRSQLPENVKSKDMAHRLEHRKRRKRRNKRVIAEITTTPREDLLKLKVRLTPCPPRITSRATSNGGSGSVGANNHTKEKLLQMRAIRREKLKAIVRQRAMARENTKLKEFKEDVAEEAEETIEDIIDSIPDEVVHIAQNIGNINEETKSKESVAAEKMTISKKSAESKTLESSDEPEKPKKDEEILRRLGLIAVNEAADDKMAKQRAQSNTDKTISLNREKLEKQLRESKANRVRSLLAEKQMRDALKTIMSTKEDLTSSVIKTPTSTPISTVVAVATTATSTTTTAATTAVTAAAFAPTTSKKKEPPPLTPLRVTKPSGFAATSVIVSNITSKYETPLDLSNGGTTANDNVLDLSATLPDNVHCQSTLSSSSSSSSSSPSLYSSSSSLLSSCTVSLPLLPLSRLPAQSTDIAGSVFRKSKELEQQRGKGQQESNLKTLSEAAVSRLTMSTCLIEKNPAIDSLALASTNAAASKITLRIPQPHHRISGFGIKIKPNLGVRHIPNPQAVVVSQYRNQKLFQRSYFNVVPKPS